jgi:hypothetical protein
MCQRFSYNKKIGKLTLSSPCLHPGFHPLTPLFSGIRKVRKCQYQMLNLSIQCTRIERNYNSRAGRSSENLCSSSGGAQEKRKTGWKSGTEFHPLLNANVLFFAGFFWISPCVWPNSGYSPCLFLTLWISLITSYSLDIIVVWTWITLLMAVNYCSSLAISTPVRQIMNNF